MGFVFNVSFYFKPKITLCFTCSMKNPFLEIVVSVVVFLKYFLYFPYSHCHILV